MNFHAERDAATLAAKAQPAVISGVDSTLVTNEKVLTERTRAAAAALRANGILFSLISSRPPRGLRMLIAPLGITAPIVCFNGGMLVTRKPRSSLRSSSAVRRRPLHGRHARRTPSRCLDLQWSGLAGALHQLRLALDPGL